MMVGHPVRVAAPQGELVSLGVLKDHLGVVGAHDDARIAALLAAAVAHLDGWRGALGRCILTQSWRVDYDDEGTHLLPFPDVSDGHGGGRHRGGGHGGAEPGRARILCDA
jgi:hypothetical protein